MIHIETRQNSKGNWWCNGTINGYDEFVEERTIPEAMAAILEVIKSRGINIDNTNIVWEAAKYYPVKPPPKDKSNGFIYPTYTNFRIDKGMV